MNVILLPPARLELREAILYFEDKRDGLGAEFREKARRSLLALPGHRLLYRERRGGYRRFNFPRFPYYIPYYIRPDHIVVPAIAHTASRPEYWINRPLE